MQGTTPSDIGLAQRVLGVRHSGRRGPLVLVVVGQHGNEPRGVEALARLLAALGPDDVAGRLVGLVGNRAALARGVRHQGQDLNRLWTAEELAALEVRPPAEDTPDRAELRELHAAIAAELAAQPARDVALIDLHSTSAGGAGFTVVADSVPSRLLARALPLPAVLGLEERLSGPLLTWMADQGFKAVVLEGGQHSDPTTTRTCLAGLWVLLARLGVVSPARAEVCEARAHLARVSEGLPRVMDLSYVHPVAAGDTYVMEPGWRNFMRVRRDQSLALQNGELVQAPLDGYMLMPLYQGLGAEGYFLCRPVSTLWLTASRWLRRLRLEWVLLLLPGVRGLGQEPGERGVLHRVCRSRRRLAGPVVAALHLFGFRKREVSGLDSALWAQKPQRR